MSNNKQSRFEDLAYWKNNAEENYITTPISVLKYIHKLEKHIETIKAQLPSDEEIEFAKENAWSTYEYEEGNLYSTTFNGGFELGAQWMRDKIHGGNK